MPVPTPAIQIIYNGVNISHDISQYLISVLYIDKSEDEADEFEIEVEDIDALWRNEWYPTKGDSIQAKIGYKNQLIDCGIFKLDEIEASGPPDVLRLRCQAAPMAKNLRTKKSSAHEKKTLLQLAQYVAKNNGFTIVGSVPNIVINRATQHRETDLHWLRRLSMEYGIVFSLRNKQLIFTSIYDLEAAASVSKIERGEMIEYKFTDKFTDTYTSAHVSYHDPVNNKLIDTTYHSEKRTNADGISYNELVKDDVLKIYTKTENQTQATAKAKAALYRANTKNKTCEITVQGNMLFCSGNNFDVTGMGVYSSKYNIQKSVHKITKGNGYTTVITGKAVATVKKALNKPPVKKPKPKPKSNPPGKNTHGQCVVLTNKNVSFANSINAGS